MGPLFGTMLDHSTWSPGTAGSGILCTTANLEPQALGGSFNVGVAEAQGLGSGRAKIGPRGFFGLEGVVGSKLARGVCTGSLSPSSAPRCDS